MSDVCAKEYEEATCRATSCPRKALYRPAKGVVNSCWLSHRRREQAGEAPVARAVAGLQLKQIEGAMADPSGGEENAS